MKISIATSGRADWGLLSPLAKALAQRAEVEVLATNMHLNPAYGYTVDEIIADGFDPVRIPADGAPHEVAAQTLLGFGKHFQDSDTDCLVILGDRYEMLAVAQAATLAGIPIVHIAGGAISQGAFDDSFRHAITKLSWMHLTETEEYRRRVIQLGEDPARVIATGAIGLHSMLGESLLSKQELEESLGYRIDRDTLLVTLHASTLEKISPVEQMRNLVQALETSPYKILYTYPNNDVDAAGMIRLIEDHARRDPERVHAIPSLGHKRYLSALQYVGAVVGNSSSGIVEVPSAGIPTLDIGIRQRGRTAAPSVVHCGADTESIAACLSKVMSPEIQEIAAKKENPYYKKGTLDIMVDAIIGTPHQRYPVKRFYDYGKE